MAEKRSHQEEAGDAPAKRPCVTDAGDSTLPCFIDWCKKNNLTISEKVSVGRDGSCAQYGMVAAEDIAEGECLFEVPRSLLLWQETTSISELLAEESAKIFSESGWVSLLLALLHERSRADSKWKAYLEIVPDFKQLNQPMFWPTELMENQLQGTGVPQAVNQDLTNILSEFHRIVLPFMKNHPDLFPEECHDLELYKKLVAFVMAYSFTEPKSAPEDDDEEDDDDDDEDEVTPRIPMMVPMADMLNHIAKNNARLDFGEESLKMVAIKAIKKGEEVYNTYGELPNWQLMQMYGFAEPNPDNHFDTVELPMPLLLEAVLEAGAKEESMDQRWNHMKDMGLVSADGMFVLGTDGILTEEDMLQALKIFSLSEEDYKTFLDSDGWLEENDEEQHTLTFEGVAKLSKEWKAILKKMAEERLVHYDSTLENEQKLLKSPGNLTSRERYSCYVRYGQLKLLQQLIDATAQSTE